MKQKTIRVFEHGVLRVGEHLTPAQFDALVAFNDAERGEFFRVGHRRLRFRHYVGFVQVGSLSIEVLPKADKSSGGELQWRAALLDMLRIAGNVHLHRTSQAHLDTTHASLLELYVAQFVRLTQRLLHEGLAKSYRRVRRNGPVFRGRLLLGVQLRKNASRPHFSYTEQTTYDRNTLPNATLLAALEAISSVPLSARLRAEVQRTLIAFPEGVEARVDLPALERLRLGRNTARYQEALTLAALILRHRRPDLARGRADVFALMLDMNALWERYVLALLRRVAPKDLSVRGQDSRPFWRASGHRTRSIRPDIVLYRNDVPVLVIDTKWKRPKNARPDASDLQQMFAYNELFACPRAMLLYPGGSGAVGYRGSFEDRKHSCSVEFMRLMGDAGYSVDVAVAEARGILSSE